MHASIISDHPILSLRRQTPNNRPEMIRQPPTSIALTARDVEWHLQRIRQQESVQNVSFERLLQEQLSIIPPLEGEEEHAKRTLDSLRAGVVYPIRSKSMHRSSTPVKSFDVVEPIGGRYDGSVEITAVTSSGRSSPMDALLTACTQISESGTEDRHMPVLLDPSLLPSNEPHQPCYRSNPRASSHPFNHTFDFGGFMENMSNNSSPVSQEASTPQGTPYVIRRLRTRLSLLAPPPFRSEASSSSKERRFTACLPSRVTSSSTTELWLLQPPRRPKAYRPRTLSYSYVESERASGTYESYHLSDDYDSPSELDFRAYHEAHQEMRRNSFQISNSSAEFQSHPPDVQGAERSGSVASSAEHVSARRNDSSCSLSLPVPPVFSAAPRCLLDALPLPLISEVESRSTDHCRDSPELCLGRFECTHETTKSSDAVMAEDHMYSSTRTVSGLVILPRQISLRSAPPRCPWPSPTAPAPTPELHESSPHLFSSPSHTSQRLRVYDDRVSAFFQPQTPQNLPEDRHRSRFHPSYTAPAGQRGAAAWAGRSRIRHHRGSRSDSPPGLDTPGYRGLYGGFENTEDEVLFNRAARRLWELQEARRNGTSTSNTPERELSLRDDGIRNH